MSTEAAPASPTVDPRPTPASSTAPARNIPVPELPQAAAQNTKEGFKAFVAHYVALLDYAYQTGDTKPALALGDAECTMCGTVTKDIASTEQLGTWLVGGRITVDKLATDGIPDIDKRWFALVTLTQAPWTNFNASGSLGENKGSTLTVVATAEYVDGAWRMWDLGTIPGAKP